MAGEEFTSNNIDIIVEKALVVIKPDAAHKYIQLEDLLLNAGFTILQKRRVHLTPEQVFDLYADHRGRMYFPTLLAFMSSAPVYVMVVARQDCINTLLDIVGPADSEKARQTHPQSIRACYGTDEMRNAIHVSDSMQAAQREIQLIFRDNIVSPVPIDNLAKDYIKATVYPTLLKGLTALSKAKSNKPAVWLAEWLLANNPYRPRISSQLGATIDA